MIAAPFVVPEVVELAFRIERSLREREQDAAAASAVRRLTDVALLQPLREFLGRPGKLLRGRMLEFGYRLAQGESALPEELGLIVESLHAGSLIIDDIQDDSLFRRGAPCLHRCIGLPLALNAGNFLYFWPQQLLARCALPDAERLRAFELLAHSLTRCHQGQALDLCVRVDELPQAEVPDVAFAIAERKTGELVSLAMALGALAAGAERARFDAIAAFGSALGVGLQMLDDLSGLHNPRRRAKAYEDLVHARATFVWGVLARELDAGAYEQLRRELRALRGGAAPEVTVERIRFRLGSSGTRHARQHFEQALSRLRAQLGAGTLFEGLEREWSRLERSYAEG